VNRVDVIAKALAQIARADAAVRKAVPIVRAQAALSKIAALNSITEPKKT
jgi:hypothetical protein